MKLLAGRYTFDFPRPALVMGVVNVTPDSFSDGGLYQNTEDAVQHALVLIREGAEIIDVGGESTHPRSAPVDETEELHRVLPVIERLAAVVSVPISIDTQKAGVARAALKAGASIVNDIAANRTDPEMWDAVAESGAGYILTHMQGTPQTMQIKPTYKDVVREVSDFFEERLDRLAAAGVRCEQTLLDAGIGFGKTLEHNLQLLGGLRFFLSHKRPMVLGVSRKSFIGKLLGMEIKDRLPGALACTTLGVEAGVNVFRTHDVPETLQAIRMSEAILARR